MRGLYRRRRTTVKLWVSIVITVVICVLFVLVGISILPVKKGKAEPWGNIAESSANHTIIDLYRNLFASP